MPTKIRPRQRKRFQVLNMHRSHDECEEGVRERPEGSIFHCGQEGARSGSKSAPLLVDNPPFVWTSCFPRSVTEDAEGFAANL